MAVAHRIYAEALFGAAKDAGRLAPVHEALGDFAVAIAESRRAAQPAARAELEVRDPPLTSPATRSRCSRTSSGSSPRRGARVSWRRSRRSSSG